MADGPAGDRELVSVVLPTRDRPRLLGAALASVVRQQAVNLEVIIVDDASCTPIPRRGFPWEDRRVRVVRHRQRLGVAAVRNRGVAEAHGGWIAFLDDDDVWAPDKLRRQLEALEAGDAGFAYGGAALVAEGSSRVIHAPAPPADRLPALLRSVNAIPAGASNVIASTQLVRRLGGFDERLRHLADWDLWIRLAHLAPAAACEHILVGYRLHSRSMRSTAPGVRGELRSLDAKHHHQCAASRERAWVFRWLAEGHLLNGRRLGAARAYADAALRARSLADLRRAARSLVAGSRGHWFDPRVGPAGGPPPSPQWLWDYLPEPNGRRRSPIASGPRGRGAEILRRALALALVRAWRLSGLRLGLALVYHEVTEVSWRPPQREVVPTVEAAVLAGQIDHLMSRYRLVPAGDLAKAVGARRRGHRFPVAVTFDDDLRSHRETALPVLSAAGGTATFFLTGASLHAPCTFWWERLQQTIDRGLSPPPPGGVGQPPGAHPPRAATLAEHIQSLSDDDRRAYSEKLLQGLGGEPGDSGLRTDDVRELSEAGFEVGFHTRAHQPLPSVGSEALAAGLHEGREQLEAAAGQSVTILAYPHGAADARVASAARAAGYRYGFTTAGQPITPHTDPLLMGRFHPAPGSPGRFALEIARAIHRGGDPLRERGTPGG